MSEIHQISLPFPCLATTFRISSFNPVEGNWLAFANIGNRQMNTANDTSGIERALAWEDGNLSVVGAALSRDIADRQKSG